MSQLEIRHINSRKQIENVAELGAEIWTEHYSPIIGLDQVNYMLAKYQSPAAIETQIKEGYQYFSLLYNNKMIGYLSIQNRKDHLFISKIYIHKDFRGNGFFSQAFEFIKQKTISQHIHKIELTVNKYNNQSIEVYKKIGFKIIESAVFDIGHSYVMDDYIMQFEVLQ
jgi:RimJ/RimL family protein N-acetyltransferase